jgi:hypothetical protein
MKSQYFLFLRTGRTKSGHENNGLNLIETSINNGKTHLWTSNDYLNTSNSISLSTIKFPFERTPKDSSLLGSPRSRPITKVSVRDLESRSLTDRSLATPLTNMSESTSSLLKGYGGLKNSHILKMIFFTFFLKKK